MAARLDRALATRRARRPSHSDRSMRGARSKRHDLSRDPIIIEQTGF
ncbi:hypothetical protein [Sphingomonas nostoxanthinifaciens]|nr:hypothetical protein [Sphingomonas nostoxanthinifaciens]UAK23652.1 hypothetical protein K8P63_14855 [Sphingomonas nostoxanthinifaciens]